MLRAFALHALCTAMRVDGLAFQKALFADGMMCAHSVLAARELFSLHNMVTTNVFCVQPAAWDGDEGMGDRCTCWGKGTGDAETDGRRRIDHDHGSCGRRWWLDCDDANAGCCCICDA